MEQQNYHQHHSIALEPYNGSTTYIDISQSDTIPSISFDENLLQPSSLNQQSNSNSNQPQQSKEFFLKELHDKIANLREENFDLKMKIYLLQNNYDDFYDNDKNCKVKQKILREFDRKNDEIRLLKHRLMEKENEIERLIHKQHNNDEFKLNLIKFYKQLINNLNCDKRKNFKSITDEMKKFFQKHNIEISIDDGDDLCQSQYRLINESTQTDQLDSNDLKLLENFRNNRIDLKTFLRKLSIDCDLNNGDNVNSDNEKFKQNIYQLLSKQLKNLDELNRKISNI